MPTGVQGPTVEILTLMTPRTLSVDVVVVPNIGAPAADQAPQKDVSDTIGAQGKTRTCSSEALCAAVVSLTVRVSTAAKSSTKIT